MTSSLLDAPVRVGSQTPRVRRVPSYDYSEGPRAVEAARRARLFLDPWQKLVLTDGLGVAADGDWTAKKADLWVPRQNGKGGIIEGLELYWLFGLDVVCGGCGWSQLAGLARCTRCKAEVAPAGPALIEHTAHRQDTADKAYLRMASLIKKCPEYHARVRLYRETNGKEQIELQDGRVQAYKTRGRGGGRGDTSPARVNDEAQELTAEQVADTEPTTSAAEYSQTWYFGTPPKDPGAWCYALREDGAAGQVDQAHWDWGLDVDLEDRAARELALGMDAAYAANPAMGLRIRESTVVREQRPSSLGESYFAERLGIWLPRVEPGGGEIDVDAWEALADPGSRRVGDVVFAVDMNPKRTHTSIAAWGRRADGRGHAELVAYEAGSKWVAGRLVELRAKHSPVAFALDPAGPAGALVPAFAEVGIAAPEDADRPRRGDLLLPTAAEMSAASGQLLDEVSEGAFAHLGADKQPQLTRAALGVRTRSRGDALGFGRRASAVDIAPLVAITVARWAFNEVARAPSGGPNVW